MAEQNSYDFWTRYSNLCLKCKVCPLRSVIKHVRGTRLCCQVERIRSEHWQFLLSALSVDNSLTEVCFKSDLPSLEEQKELWKKRRRKKEESYPCPYGYSPHNISDICKYSARLLTGSKTLQTLIIENLPITKEDALHLAEGLKSTLLKEFALRHYPYSDEVIEIICRGLWDSNVLLLDFTACNLSLEGLSSIQNVIMKHKARRTIQAFPDTLRYRLPVFEEMMGLARIILNGNQIGDKGVEMICEAISDDRWIRALDLQCCGITNEGARILLDQITQNNSMQVIDLRLNKIDRTISEQISRQLRDNSFGKIFNYTDLPLWKPKSFSKSIPVRKTKFKTKVSKKYSVVNKVIKKDAKDHNSSLRISCEILGAHSKQANTKDAAVQTIIVDEVKYLKERNKNLQLTILKGASRTDSLMELIEKFKSENAKVRHINEKLRLENFNLRQEILRCSVIDGAILIDQETYDEIRHVFEKFQRFLKLMKDNGLWDLVTTVGVAAYENTRLKAVPSESRVRLVEKEHSPPDGCPSNGPLKVPSIPKPQRYCSCGKPDCISNQKAEKKNYSSYMNPAKHENVVDREFPKLFKELRETYTNSGCRKQVPPKSNRKHSLGDLPSGQKLGPTIKPFSLKCVLNRDIPNKFKQFKTRQDLYDAVRSEMERMECACQIHNAQQSSDKSSQSAKKQSHVNNKRNVSSQTVAVESLSSHRYQKVNPATSSNSASSGVSQKVAKRSHSPTKACGLQALSHVAKEWDEHVKKNFPDCNIEPQGTAAAAVAFNSILGDPDYFKSSAASKSEKCLPPNPVSNFPKERSKSQGSSKSNTNENVGSFSGESVESSVSEQSIKENKEPATLQSMSKSISSRQSDSVSGSSIESRPSEQKIEAKSNHTSSGVENSGKSYLESVSDASTDKDVKSLSLSDYVEAVISDHNYSKSSNNNSKTANQKVANKSGFSPSVANSKSSSSKSSKKSQKQKKKSNQSQKVPKEKVSSSSVPSLSDITTVSSHSLNTDLVMDQLSESDKGLS